MSAKGKVRPRRPKQHEASKLIEKVRASIDAELGRLYKTHALLTARHVAAVHEAEFVVSDAIAALVERVDQHIEALDRLQFRIRFDVPVKQPKQVTRQKATKSR